MCLIPVLQKIQVGKKLVTQIHTHTHTHTHKRLKTCTIFFQFYPSATEITYQKTSPYSIGFTLLYFKMAVIPFVPKTKMADVGKLINLENLLVRKVTWFVLTTTSASLILSRASGTDHMTRINYIFLRLPRTHSLTFWLPETTRILYLFLPPSLPPSLSLSSFWLPETAWPCQLVRHNSIRVTCVRIHSATFFFPVLPYRLDLFQYRTQPQKFRQIPKETTNQHGRRHVPPRIHCYISVYWYLARNT